MAFSTNEELKFLGPYKIQLPPLQHLLHLISEFIILLQKTDRAKVWNLLTRLLLSTFESDPKYSFLLLLLRLFSLPSSFSSS
jgi:hypothetical protein